MTTITLSSGRAIEYSPLAGVLDLYRPDQPRDANGRFTADPGGRMRTQVRRHTDRAAFHERKAEAHLAGGKTHLADAHSKLAANHRDIASGLHLEHSMKHGSGPQPQADFVPGKKPGRDPAKAMSDFEKLDAIANSKKHATPLEVEKKPEAPPAANKAPEGKQNYFDHLAENKKAMAAPAEADPSRPTTPPPVSSFEQTVGPDTIVRRREFGNISIKQATTLGDYHASHEHGNIAPGDLAAKVKFHAEQRSKNFKSSRLYDNPNSYSQAVSAYHAAKGARHAEEEINARQAIGRQILKAQSESPVLKADAKPTVSSQADRYRGGQGARVSVYRKNDPQRVVFVRGNTYHNRELLRNSGAVYVPSKKGWAITAGAVKDVSLPKGLRVDEYSRSLTLSHGQVITLARSA